MNRKPVLVLLFGTPEAVNVFEKKWLIKSKPLLDENAIIMHYPKEENLDSIIDLILGESELSEKEYIFLVKGSKDVKDFKYVAESVSSKYSNYFKSIRFVFTHLPDNEHWTEDDVEVINSIPTKNNLSSKISDIFDSEVLHVSKKGEFANHISTSTRLLFDIIDVTKYLYDESTNIDSDLHTIIEGNIRRLLDLHTIYAESIKQNDDESRNT